MYLNRTLCTLLSSGIDTHSFRTAAVITAIINTGIATAVRWTFTAEPADAVALLPIHQSCESIEKERCNNAPVNNVVYTFGCYKKKKKILTYSIKNDIFVYSRQVYSDTLKLAKVTQDLK